MVVLIPVLVGEDFYTALLLQQYGAGMPRYRGSPMLGGSFWSSILSFTKNLAARAAPHVSSLINQARPHVRAYASRAVESAIDGAVEKVTAKLNNMQSGTGRKRRKEGIKAKPKRKKPIKRTVKKKKVVKKITKKRKGTKGVKKSRITKTFENISDKF